MFWVHLISYFISEAGWALQEGGSETDISMEEVY